LLLVAACDENKQAVNDPSVEAWGKQGGDQQTGAHPTTPPGMPPGAASAGAQVSGEVLEVLDVASYTYLKLKTASGEEWAAVSKTAVEKGAKVNVVGANLMHDFKSETLDRTFKQIYFGNLAPVGHPDVAAAEGSQPTAPAMAGGDAPMRPHPGGMVPAADVGDLKVAKAEGADGRTVAEVYAQIEALVGKPVAVRGKVVKFNANIMGKNWLHLRDGTGAEGKDNDLTVTTQDQVKVGDEVVIKGTAHKDRDFGAGYRYAVIVEEASVSK
jgi:hypothetical protein